MKKIIAVIGDARCVKGEPKYDLAFNTGKALIDAGYRIQCGGLAGVMTAVCEGARASSNYKEGDTIALIPSFDREKVNEFADIVIPTGMDIMRNAMVANADAVVAIGGGAGTLSEMAIAWSMFRLIIGYTSVEGWSKTLAGQVLDWRKRYPKIEEDCIYPAQTPEDVVALLEKYIGRYTRKFGGLHWSPENVK